MKHRSFIALAVVLFVLLGSAVGVYAYDATRENRIAEGITAGGVEIGGLEAAEARASLDRELAAPLRRPVSVRHAGREFRLSAEQARVRTDVGGMVAEALERSRRGNVLTRSVRDLTGGEVRADLASRVTYSKAAVSRLVRRVRGTYDRPAKDASLSYSGGGINPVPGRSGKTLRAGALAKSVGRELTLPAGERVVRPRFRTVKPKVTRANLAERYPTVVTVDRSGFRLRLYRNLKLARTYTVAVGQAGLDTPAGLYNVQNKAVDPAWHVPKRAWAGKLAGRIIPGGRADNPLKARWMGIFDGAGIHGTSDVGSLGSRASHGCIRMAVPDVKELYEKVEVGTPVFIA